MDKKKKEMIPPIIVTILLSLYYILYFALLITVLDGIWKYLLGIFPIVFAIILAKVCINRINEIKGGEADDISKYWLY